MVRQFSILDCCVYALVFIVLLMQAAVHQNLYSGNSGCDIFNISTSQLNLHSFYTNTLTVYYIAVS